MNFNLVYRDYGSRDVEQGDDEWDYEWTEDHSYDYEHAVIVTSGYCEVSLFPGEEEVKKGDDLHVVYVSYDSGDSFGREYGRRTHLWAFKDKARAMRLADEIAKDARANPDYDFDNEPMTFEGVPINTNEWKGYFEHFVRSDIETVTVRK